MLEIRMSRKKRCLKNIKDAKRLLKESIRIKQGLLTLGYTEPFEDVEKNKMLISMA